MKYQRPTYWTSVVATVIRAPFLQDEWRSYPVFTFTHWQQRPNTEGAHTQGFLSQKTLLLLNCKSWLCPPWWKPIASLCLYSCLREDFCLCAFRPLQTFITSSGPKIQTIPRHSCIFATVFLIIWLPKWTKVIPVFICYDFCHHIRWYLSFPPLSV